jgi:uncharacterized repeat protein (TIGR03803 family)
MDGNFYGTTSYGGTFGAGTIFQMTPGGMLTVTHAFQPAVDGGGSDAPLILKPDGNFYGTTTYAYFGHGTVFEVTPDGVLTVLYAFTGGLDGNSPRAGLLDPSGVLYGTTPSGGTGHGGVVFAIPLTSSSLTTNVQGPGSVMSTVPAGITCPIKCVGTYLSGTTVTLTATPSANAVFDGWKGCDSTVAGHCIVQLNSARAVTAMFTPVFWLTATFAGNGTAC